MHAAALLCTPQSGPCSPCLRPAGKQLLAAAPDLAGMPGGALLDAMRQVGMQLASVRICFSGSVARPGATESSCFMAREMGACAACQLLRRPRVPSPNHAGHCGAQGVGAADLQGWGQRAAHPACSRQRRAGRWAWGAVALHALRRAMECTCTCSTVLSSDYRACHLPAPTRAAVPARPVPQAAARCGAARCGQLPHLAAGRLHRARHRWAGVSVQYRWWERLWSVVCGPPCWPLPAFEDTLHIVAWTFVVVAHCSLAARGMLRLEPAGAAEYARWVLALNVAFLASEARSTAAAAGGSSDSSSARGGGDCRLLPVGSHHWSAAILFG